MIAPVQPTLASPIEYIECDGIPMADNSVQLDWILLLLGNIAAIVRDRSDVFVSSNQYWFPVEGAPHIKTAPDCYVVFGRPKQDRTSYMQWLEDNVPMTVTFEIRSPSNSDEEMSNKRLFYEEYGVEEYYMIDPSINRLEIWQRQGAVLRRIYDVPNYVSKRLGIRFERTEDSWTIYRPNGVAFLPYEDIDAEADAEKQRAEMAEQRADLAEQRADHEKKRADLAEQRQREEQERARRVLELTRKLRRGEATPEDLSELDQLCP